MANKNNELKPIVIGKAYFVDLPKYIDWLTTEDAEEFFSIENLWTGCLYHLQGEIQGVDVGKLHDKCNSKNWQKRYTSNPIISAYIEPLKKCVEYIEEFSTPDMPLSFKLTYEHEDKFDIIFFGNKQFIVPKWAIRKEMLKDYSDRALSEIRSLKSLDGMGQGIIPIGSALSTTSQAQVKNKINNANDRMADLKSKMKEIEDGKTDELAKLKKEIEDKMAVYEKKKQDLLAELEAKENELNAKKEELERELFMLESEIYSIRCFLGEVVDFVKLRSGVSAPVDAPITLFQKIRFLDEELGKLVSIYDFDFDDIKKFERLLKHRDDIVDVFCPNDKCISLIRISKTGEYYGWCDIREMLTEYEVYHGMTIGILIRNGENLYIGWTDDEKININDDNFFYAPEDKKVINEEDEGRIKKTSVNEMVSRYFVFSILQGALCNSKLLALPEEAKPDFTRPSEYIVYSVADTWLTDNRYGTFDEMIKKCNSRIVAGDYVLTLEYQSDNEGYRGHSDYRNLTRDVCVRDRGIYQIRLVETHTDEEIEKDHWLSKVKYYISLKKNYDDKVVYRGYNCYERKRDAYALFHVYDDEFINLTYMNSAWLKYVITTQHLGDTRRRLGHYAEAIRYLNDALKFIKKREEEEAKWLSQYVTITDDMWASLSDWKLEKGVRSINDYQAKRFAKWYNK